MGRNAPSRAKSSRRSSASANRQKKGAAPWSDGLLYWSGLCVEQDVACGDAGSGNVDEHVGDTVVVRIDPDLVAPRGVRDLSGRPAGQPSQVQGFRDRLGVGDLIGQAVL